MELESGGTRDDLAVARWTTAHASEIESMGLRITQHSDFAEFQHLNRILKGSGPSAPLSDRFVDIDPSDLFWLQVRDEEDALVSLQAMVREKITTALDRHLDQKYRRLYTDPDGGRIVGHAPALSGISGMIAYHADLFVAKSWRRRHAAALLGRLAIGLAHLRWELDYVWGYVSAEMVKSGYPCKIGYWRMQPRGTHYDPAPKSIRSDDWFVWMTVEDLRYMIQAIDPRST